MANPQALAESLSQFFAPQATRARLAYQPDTWKILLEAEHPPDRHTCLQTLSQFLRQVTLPPGIEVYGRQQGVSTPAWGVRLRPTTGSTAPGLMPSVPANLSSVVVAQAPDASAELDLPKDTQDALHQAGVMVASIGLVLSLGAGLWWWSPGTWIENAPLPTPAEIQATLKEQAATILPPPPPLTNTLKLPPTARAKVITQAQVPANRKVVALTFDDGPDPNFTPQVLKILNQAQVKATFFVIGQSVAAYPELTRTITDSGHILANHSWDHRYRQFSPDQAQADLAKTDAMIQKMTGQPSYWFRPPGGRMESGLVSQAQKDAQAVIMWSVDPRDWQPGRSSAQIQQQVIQQTRPGGIVLLHDGGGPRQATVAALPGIIKSLKQKGYEFVTIPELLQIQQEMLQPQPKPQAWFGITNLAQLHQLDQKLAAEKASLKQQIAATFPTDRTKRETLATQYQDIAQAHHWVKQRLELETPAQIAWEQALKSGQAAVAAGKANQLTQANQHWQTALNFLAQIPERSFLGPLAKAKISDYQRHRQAIQPQIEQARSQFLTKIAQQAGLSDLATLSLCTAQENCYTLRGDTVLPSAASLIKLPLAVVATHWAQNQPQGLDTPIRVSPHNYTEDTSSIRTGQTYPVKTLVAEMLQRSSNIAPNQLMDSLGWDYINQVIQSYGYDSIKIYSKLVGERVQPANLGRQSNANSTRELSLMMSRIYHQNNPQTQFLQAVLGQQQDREMGQAALASTSAQWLGEKTGQNSLVVGSVVAFQVRGQIYSLAIMESNRVGVSQIRQAIKAIATYVIEHPQEFPAQKA